MVFFEPLLFKSAHNGFMMLVVIWHLATFWYVFLKLVGDPLRNFYRLRTNLDSCEYVQTWRKDHPTVYLAGQQSKLLTQLLERLEAVRHFLLGPQGTYSIRPVQRSSAGTCYYEDQCVRFSFFPGEQSFLSHRVARPSSLGAVQAAAVGLAEEEACQRLELVGENLLRVEVDSWPTAFAKEFSGFYYLYQWSMLWIYFYWSYWQMGLVALAVILMAGTIKVWIKRGSELKLKAMAEHTMPVKVYRQGSGWKNLDSSYVVPGDVVRVNSHQQMLFDAMLLNGGPPRGTNKGVDCSVIVDESSLTGESMPISKFPVPPPSAAAPKTASSKGEIGKKHILYDGTRVLQVNTTDGSEGACALVVGTGAASEKGQLVSSMLFSSKVAFIFDLHLKLVFLVLGVWALLVFGIVIWFVDKAGAGAWLTGIFVLAQCLSPLLPSVLVIGQSVAAERLKKKQIFCVNLERITISGKVNLFCFDKTGTLTKKGLEYTAFQSTSLAAPASSSSLSSSPSLSLNADPHSGVPFFKRLPEQGDGVHFLSPHASVVSLPGLIQLGLGSAHTLAPLGNRLLGNPVDVEMFRASGWELEKMEPPSPGSNAASSEVPGTNQVLNSRPATHEMPDGVAERNPNLLRHLTLARRARILKRFEFDHTRMSMSVVVSEELLQPDNKEQKGGQAHLFVKGSYEKIQTLCRRGSLPPDFETVTSQHAKDGCYVLALAYRPINILPAVGEGEKSAQGERGALQLRMEELACLSREDAEAEGALELLGLLLFRNNLKVDSAKAIAQLKRGAVRPVMITGDNALTGLFVAGRAGMTLPYSQVLLGELAATSLQHRSLVETKQIDKEEGAGIEDDSVNLHLQKEEVRGSGLLSKVSDMSLFRASVASPLQTTYGGVEATASGEAFGDSGGLLQRNVLFRDVLTNQVFKVEEVLQLIQSQQKWLTYQQYYDHDDEDEVAEGSNLADEDDDWVCLPNEENNKNQQTKPKKKLAEMRVDLLGNNKNQQRSEERTVVELALTGPAFEQLVAAGQMQDLLMYTRVFARMTPALKVKCVELHMKRGITAMCGDGGNDCGALRAAHTGIAISDSEASIVAPFSTRDRSPLTCVTLLREGRAALATSFANYKFLLMYGQTTVIAKLIYAYYSVSLAEWVWIMLDSFFVVTLSYTLSLCGPALELAPCRPTAKLLGPETVLSCVSTVLINACFTSGAILWLNSQVPTSHGYVPDDWCRLRRNLRLRLPRGVFPEPGLLVFLRRHLCHHLALTIASAQPDELFVSYELRRCRGSGGARILLHNTRYFLGYF
eukprot:gb/GEZN01000399.1/.p1 GENE.gb/GEZN01000399.1/~~gb/GEZN01000399.1/.p1  ORF type:complete len:1294 (+),score=224.38 gb/GEZN01000399.1/:365-4246(+)